MQGGPLSVTLKYSAQAVSSATSAAAAANLLLQEGGSAAQPLSLLSAFASVSNANGQLDKASGPAVPGVEDCQWRLAVQRQHCRQLSHYTASTSGRASSGSWPPLLGSSSTATASRRGSSANLAARWRAFSSSSAAAAAARRPHSSSPERSFASQPAFAYDEPDYDAAAAVEAAATLQRAQQAVETLKARAQERLAEARAMAASPSPFGEPGAVSDMRRMERTEVADLVKVQKVEEMAATDTPVWERLSHYSSGWHRGETMAALHLYRQEVQMGHDSDALNQSTRGAFGPGLGHVPFLRSGLLAAHQGFGLQSELSRAALPARLAPAVASGAQPPAVSPRTRSAVHGLHLAMDLTRSAALQGAEEQAEAEAEALHVLAEAEAAVAAVVASRSAAAVGGAPGRSSGVAGAGALAEAAAAAAAEELEDELLLEESDQGGLLEALDWQERLRHENLGERLSAARSLRARRQSLSAAKAAGAAKPRSSRLFVSCPTPAATEEALLEALAGVPGLQVTEKMRTAVQGLYATPRPRLALSAPLQPAEDPAACAARAAGMAQLLLEELGTQGCVDVVAAASWVLLLDPHTHGCLQLAALHLVELDPAQRAAVVKAMPRLLQLDVDQALLPLLEYLQGLGMSTQDMASVLLQDPCLADPSTLPMLKAAVAFWRGKGMSRQGLVKLITARPKIVRTPVPKLDLTFSWLADHTGLSMDDVAPCATGFARSLTSVIGPRIAYAQHKSLKVANPTEAQEGGRGGGRLYNQEGVISLRRLLTFSPGAFLKRVGGDATEFEAFRERWLREDFPAWLQRHRPGIEHYRSLTHPLHQARTEAQQQHQ